ncbi:unnamed protein product [Coregonus sp. 'balchen']|nr:unnamed protein product [Coregonus sp. 'balchen']
MAAIRPFEMERPRHRPFLIGVSGGTAICAKIMELLGQNKVDHRQRKVAIVSQDSFYRVLTPDQKAKALKGHYNFDHPGCRTGSRCTPLMWFCLRAFWYSTLRK